MSANGIRRRFQKDISKLNHALRAQETKNNNKFMLPGFEQTHQLLPKNERKQDITEVGIAPGDLVYVTKGEHKGKITNVFRYTSEFDTVYLSDISEKKIIPKEQWFEQQDSYLVDYPSQIPRSHIKLAAKDVDEQGNTYYIVADDVVMKGRYFDEGHNRFLPRRYIKHHETIEVPWPAPSAEPEDGPLSTSTEAALEKTYEFQSIARPPFPSAIMSQLRNPYSKHKSKVLTELDVRRLAPPQMPLTKEQKIYLAKKEAAKAKPIKDLTPEIKDFIGERIANRLNGLDNPSIKAHLDALSKNTTPEFEKTMEKIRDGEEA